MSWPYEIRLSELPQQEILNYQGSPKMPIPEFP